MAYALDQHGGWKWDSICGWYYLNEYNQRIFVHSDGSADQATVAAENTKIAQGASTYHAYDPPPRREEALPYTSPIYHCPPSSSASSSSHYTISFADARAYRYQQTMGDPGDDLRAPGDSDNNGGQKGGDMAGGHRCASERNTRSQRQKRSRKR